MMGNEYHDFRSIIRQADQRYGTLHRIGIAFMQQISTEEFLNSLKQVAPSYSVIEAVEDQIQFWYLGYEWCVQFHHDTKKGLIRYSLKIRGRERQPREVSEIGFDSMGSVNDDLQFPWGAQTEHLRFLAEDAIQFLGKREHLEVDETVAFANEDSVSRNN